MLPDISFKSLWTDAIEDNKALKIENKKLRDACILADKALHNINIIDRVKAEEAVKEALKGNE